MNENPKPAEISNTSSVFWVSSPLDIPGTPLKGTSRRILTRSPNHLCSGSTPSLSRMSELLTLSLRLSPDNLRRTLICLGHYPKLVSIGEGWDVD